MLRHGLVKRTLIALGLPVAAYTALTTGYLLVLTVAALLPRKRLPAPAQLPRFDLCIPAHNEERTLPRLLQSIRALDYPSELVRVHVVADNCSDHTATIARQAGALVVERTDAERIGKGYALDRGLKAVLQCPGQPGDGVVIVDADSDVSPNLLRVLAGYIASGAQAMQTYYSVRNSTDSSMAMLRYVALCLYHYLRPLGRARLGLSAGLRGNGMCFRRDVAALGWAAHGLTEDVEQHFLLLANGVHVAFVPEARVEAEMPVTLRGAASQNSRWERGRLEALVRDAPRFLLLGARRRDPSAFDAALEQLTPPFSVCVMLCLLTLTTGAVTRSPMITRIGGAALLSQVAYVLIGLRLGGAPPMAYKALAFAPRYVVWKMWIWLVATIRPPTRWRRTGRLQEAPLEQGQGGRE